jgi:hypothetical protein
MPEKNTPATAPNLVDDDTHRVLSYVAALTSSGYEPNSDEVEAFGRAPSRRGSSVRSTVFQTLWSDLVSSTALWGQVERKEAESWVDYLARLRWIEVRNGRIKLSRAGVALLMHLNSRLEGLEAERPLVVTPDDPLAYPKVIGHIGQLDKVMLVDPYIDSLSLYLLGGEARVERILTGKKMGKGKLGELKATLGRLDQGSRPEVRTSQTLHDRFVLASDSVWTIGSSLNGIGKSLTVITPIRGQEGDALRAKLEEQWDAAMLLQPNDLGPPNDGKGSEG